MLIRQPIKGAGLCAVVLCCLALPLHAAGSAPTCDVSGDMGHESAVLMGETDEVVPLLYRHVGLKYNVPYKILYAVGLKESRRPGVGRPWPWTLNIRRKGLYFECREHALKALLDAQSGGIRSIDVGLGQVNLHWNGHLFESVEAALDPMTNLEAASVVLRREFDTCYSMTGRPDWWCAVGRYHAGGNTDEQRARAERYRASVYELWEAL